MAQPNYYNEDGWPVVDDEDEDDPNKPSVWPQVGGLANSALSAQIPPGASFGNDPSGKINQQNPFADPSKPFVQAGTTGGYIDGIGVTIGQGSSITPERYSAELAAAIAAGVPEGWAADYLQRNPGDPHRIVEAYRSEQSNSSGNGGGGGGGGNQTPTQQWNSQPSGAPAASAGMGSSSSAELYKLLMARAQQGAAVGRNDPNVRAQVDPAVAQLERASRNSLDDIAERVGPLANMTGERRLAGERTGQAAGTLEAEVIGREIEGRREEIMQALSLWGDRLSAEERLALERELGYLNDAARTADRNQRGEQFNLTLGQNDDQFMRELALREWIAGDNSDFNWSTGGL